MGVFIFINLVINIGLLLICYKELYKKRKLFDNRYSMTIAMSSSMLISLPLTLQLSLLGSTSFTLLLIINSIVGIVIGLAFGTMIRFHSILSGAFGGVMGGIMGSMVGAVVRNPSLCGLPQDTAYSLLINSIYFSLFGTILLIVSIGLILFSLRV